MIAAASFYLLLALQSGAATVAGVVRDEATGAPVAGAIVALPDLDRSVTADAAGRYRLDAVPAGPQHIAVRFIGYAPRVLHLLVPATGALEVGLALRAEPLRLGTIEVRPRLALNGFDADAVTPYPDRAASMAAIRNHPLLAVPDALQGLGGGEVTLEPESPSGVHVRGAASDQVGYLLDGIPVLSPYHSAGTFSAWNPDALAGVRLSASGRTDGAPDALAGTFAADTRVPGARHGAQGSLGTTQARLTLDGPLGIAGAGYLVSLRSGFPGYPDPQEDPSYLRSESGDVLAKLELPALGGRLRLLGYDNENELTAAGEVPADTAPRNRFEWSGGSVGAGWEGAAAGGHLRITGWHAAADAGARWVVGGDGLGMASRRRDLGLAAVLARESGGARSSAGMRLGRTSTAYAVRDTSAALLELDARTVGAELFADHERGLGSGVALDLGASAGGGAGGVYLLPRVRLAWRPAERWTVSAGWARFRQTEQSLRNPESLLGQIFPADLFIGSAASGVPEARADQLVGAADFQATSGLRVSAQVYERHSRGLLLVAPGAGDPFATAGFSSGSGTARGLALTASVRGARIGATASYGLQQVRLRDGDSSYVPTHATTHLLDAGVIAFPTPTLSIRLGAVAAAGRRTSATVGGLEWEACNLLDRGCELSGSPVTTGRPGGRRLPGYLRLDLGVRQHWHLRLGGRDASVAVFGTVTNVLGRRNILTYTADPVTGAASPVDMRPRAPLVVGLDWRL